MPRMNEYYGYQKYMAGNIEVQTGARYVFATSSRAALRLIFPQADRYPFEKTVNGRTILKSICHVSGHEYLIFRT